MCPAKGSTREDHDHPDRPQKQSTIHHDRKRRVSYLQSSSTKWKVPGSKKKNFFNKNKREPCYLENWDKQKQQRKLPPPWLLTGHHLASISPLGADKAFQVLSGTRGTARVLKSVRLRRAVSAITAICKWQLQQPAPPSSLVTESWPDRSAAKSSEIKLHFSASPVVRCDRVRTCGRWYKPKMAYGMYRKFPCKAGSKLLSRLSSSYIAQSVKM